MDNNVNENPNNSNRLRQGFSRFGYWFKKATPLIGILMPLAYLGVGCFVLLSDQTKELMQPANRYMLSGLLVIYGIFRTYRIIILQKHKDENE